MLQGFIPSLLLLLVVLVLLLVVVLVLLLVVVLQSRRVPREKMQWEQQPCPGLTREGLLLL